MKSRNICFFGQNTVIFYFLLIIEHETSDVVRWSKSEVCIIFKFYDLSVKTTNVIHLPEKQLKTVKNLVSKGESRLSVVPKFVSSSDEEASLSNYPRNTSK
jgi:hypothetical protein